MKSGGGVTPAISFFHFFFFNNEIIRGGEACPGGWFSGTALIVKTSPPLHFISWQRSPPPSFHFLIKVTPPSISFPDRAQHPLMSESLRGMGTSFDIFQNVIGRGPSKHIMKSWGTQSLAALLIDSTHLQFIFLQSDAHSIYLKVFWNVQNTKQVVVEVPFYPRPEKFQGMVNFIFAVSIVRVKVWSKS